MKIRKAKKEIKKVIGFMAVDPFTSVVNVVTNREYDGGSCVERDEDCYRGEVIYTRKRYGAPICPKDKHQEKFWELYHKIWDFIIYKDYSVR